MPMGQYLPGSSTVHRLDARAKLPATFAFLVALFVVGGALGMAVLGAGLVLVFVLARIPVGYLWRGLRPLLVILALTFVFQAFGFPGRPLVHLGPFSITEEGLRQGGFLTVRLGLLLVSSMALTLTTAPVALTDAFEWLLAPLKKVGVPSHEIALMMMIALRFIPTLFRELDDLIKAQRARGVDFTVRDPRTLSRALLPLVVPLFVLSFRRADDLAIAMTSRCYRGGEGRTRYREMRFGSRDLVAGLVAGPWLIAAVAAGRWWGL